MNPMFGTAGCCEGFYENGNKSALEMPLWLKNHNLDCFEYQCGHGVRISEDGAKQLGKNARENSIALSVHAPYYISLSSVEKEKREKSIIYLLDTMKAASNMGADRIVVHSGSCGSITRREALMLATDTLKQARAEADANGFENISICPETMGKVKQLGNVDEVIKLCLIDERFIPTVDFGHVNAMTLGSLKNKEDFSEILKKIKNKLGEYRAKCMHIHYSRIEYTNAGEKKHHTYSEKEYEPEFYPLSEVIAEEKYTPRIICESAGTQTEDAVKMKNIYLEMVK